MSADEAFDKFCDEMLGSMSFEDIAMFAGNVVGGFVPVSYFAKFAAGLSSSDKAGLLAELHKEQP